MFFTGSSEAGAQDGATGTCQSVAPEAAVGRQELRCLSPSRPEKELSDQPWGKFSPT